MLTGYCLLIFSDSDPLYRIIFKQSLLEALKAIPKVKAESKGRIEVLKMIDGDTVITREDNNEYFESRK